MLPIGTNLTLRNFPWATVGLLVVNWVLFLFDHESPYGIRFWISQYLFSIPGDQYPWQLITSLFFHGDLFHIIGNSIFLWLFGSFVEDKLGRQIFLFFYFFTGAAATLLHGIMVGLFLKDQVFVPLLGASGGISGIMGIFLYRCYYSKMKILFFFFFFPIRIQIPTMIILPLWFLFDLLGGIDSIRGIPQNVAFWAHTGGFLAGFGSCKYLHYGTQAQIERLEFVADRSAEQHITYGRDIEAAEKLLQKVPENPELHLQLARAMSRWKTSPEGSDHYQRAIRHYVKKDPLKAMDVFIEFWKKYLSVFEPRLQLTLSMLLYKHGHTDLSSHTLRALIDSPQPPDFAMEQAYLSLAKIYKTI